MVVEVVVWMWGGMVEMTMRGDGGGLDWGQGSWEECEHNQSYPQ
jgi:hypothetical protein